MGRPIGYIQSKETRKKISDSNKGKITNMNWKKDTSKIDFLTGKSKYSSILCEIVEPLTEEQAKQAVGEYHQLGYK